MATGQKAKKRKKLRHAEYYDFQEIQDKLYADSGKGKTFNHLIETITMPENIRLAYRNIKANKGSHTAGTDKRTISDLEKLSDEQLIAKVQQKFSWYVPQSVKRVEIPKDNDPNKKRPLGIPTIMDRLVQQCILQVLEPICEAKFHDHSYGFRPNRSQEHAVAQVCKNMQLSNLHYVVDIDIKGFFDNVNHGKLLKQLWTLGIKDKKLLCIISAMLKAEIAGIGFPKVGTPQGGIISPLLSNVVLNELDWWLASQWEEFPTRYPYVVNTHKNGSKDRGAQYSMMRRYSNLKVISCVRYADDFKIFTNSYQSAMKLFYATKSWLKDRLDLDISVEKSKVINLKEQYSEYLGFKFKVVPKGKYKNGKPKYVVKSHVKEKAIIKIKAKLEKLIHDMQYTNQEELYVYETISKYNSFIMGTHNYYSLATMVSKDMRPLAFSVQKSLKARFRRRIKTAKTVRKNKIPVKIPRIIEEMYGDSQQLRFIRGYAVAPIGYAQFKKPMHRKRIINSYTPEGRAEIHKKLEKVDMATLHYLMRNPVDNRSVEYNDNRLSLYSAQKGKCAVSGVLMKIGDIHCHHKTPKQLGGTDKYENLVLVCKNVHRLIHATNSETIDKYTGILKLSEKQMKTLQKFRNMVHVESC